MEKRACVEIRIDRYGYSGTSVKIGGKEIFVKGLNVRLPGPGLPEVTLFVEDKTIFEMVCEAKLRIEEVPANPETRIERPLAYEYDQERDLLIVEGIRYSGSLFRAWSSEGLPIGKRFEIVKREETGIIWLRELREEEESSV